jgi:membrane protein
LNRRCWKALRKRSPALVSVAEMPRRAPYLKTPDCETPLDVLRKHPGEVARSVWNELSEDNLSLIAAGVAYYIFLAIFPAIASIVALYGLAAEPQTIREHLAFMRAVLPAEAYQLLLDQVRQLLTQENVKLGFGFAVGLLFSMWSASRGVTSLMTAMNVAYEEQEKRGTIRINIIAVVFTICAIVTMLLTIIVIGGFSAVLKRLGLSDTLITIILLVRWPVLAIILLAGLAAIYRYGPSRTKPRFQWITPGAVFALIAWLLSSVLFSLYVENFGKYNQTFGSLAAGVILLLWLYLAAYSVCVGAELNAELEYRVQRDTTVGRPKPQGARGATVADKAADAQ